MGGLRMIQQTLYQLKREFGLQTNIVWRTSSTPNIKTGKMTVLKDSITVKRAIVLPSKIDRSFEYDLAFIASNKNFTYGGFFDKQRRRVIIDRRDLAADFEIKVGYYLIFDGNRYEIEAVSEFEERAGYLIIAKQVLQVPLENLIKRVLFSTFLPTQSVQVLKI